MASTWLAASAVAASGLGGVAGEPVTAARFGADGGIVAHRAVYEMRLDRSAGAGNQLGSLQGRMVYLYSGSACTGWRHSLRLVTRTTTPEGFESLFDARSESWEPAVGGRFRFTSESFQDGRQTETIAGEAARDVPGDETTVMMRLPADGVFTIPAAARFPSEHARAVLDAAVAGERKVSLPFFDGSEAEPKVFDTFVTIGRPGAAVSPASGTVTDAAGAAGGERAARQLAGLRWWPVTVGYFDQARASPSAAAGLPDYEMTYRMYANGVLADVRLDYGTLVLDGTLTRLEYLPMPTCESDAP